MKFGAYLAMTSPRRFFVGILWLFFCVIMARLSGERMPPDFVLISLPPFCLAQMLVDPVRRLQEAAFAVVVPRLIQSVRWSFFLVVVLASGLLAWQGHRGTAHLPGFGLWMWDALVIAMFLLLQSGPGLASFAVTLGVLVVLGADAELRGLLLTHPWSFGIVAGALAAWALYVGTSHERYRAPMLKPRRRASAAGDPEPAAIARLQQRLETLPTSAQRSTRRLSVSDWVRIAGFESRARSGLVLAIGMPFGRLIIALIAGWHDQARTTLPFFVLVNPPAYPGNDIPMPVMLLLFVFTVVFVLMGITGLRIDRVYPVSRRQRAEVCFRRMVRMEAMVALTWLLGQGVLTLITLASVRSPVVVPPVPWFVFETSLLLGAIPVACAFGTAPRIISFWRGLPIALLGVVLLGGLIALYCSASIYRLPGPLTALLVCLAFPILAHLVAWLRLNRYFARCDLDARVPLPLLFAPQPGT